MSILKMAPAYTFVANPVSSKFGLAKSFP